MSALFDMKIKGTDGVIYKAIYKISDGLYLGYSEGPMPAIPLVIEGEPINEKPESLSD